MTIEVGNHEINVEDKLYMAISGVQAVKDLVGTAVSASPPATIACAGVTVILTVCSS